jgi:SpoVK/Ycf46/Vps4 family AAA+-type ATPase
MLWDACPPKLKRDLRQRRSVIVVVEVPADDWLDLIFAATRRLFSNAQFLSKQSEKSKGETQETVLRASAMSGQSMVIMAVNGLANIQDAVLASLDYHVKVEHPTRAHIAAMIRATFGSGSIDKVPEQIGLAPASALLATIRWRESARRANSRLATLHDRLSQARIRKLPPGPRLEELSGYGAEKEWGLQLARDIQAYRRGELEWAEISSAALLHGPPGAGKTFFASALARSCQIPFFSTSLGQIFNDSDGYLGGVIKSLTRAFKEARESSPSILFIDELDALPDRASLSNRNRDWWTTVVNHFLKLLDDQREGVVVLGATNMFERLDSALIRSGRLEAHFRIELPDEVSLVGIIRHHLRERLSETDLIPIARLAQGSSGADVARLVKTATATARNAQREMTVDDLVQLLTQHDLTPEQLRRISIHEAGHAVAAFALGKHVEHLTTIRQADGLGSASIELPGRAATRKRLEDHVIIGLAGRNAELLLLGEPCDGARTDLHAANVIVAAIHGSLGLGSSLLHRAATSEALKLLDDPHFRDLVEAELRILDARCMVILTTRQDQLRAVAEALCERRALSGEEFMELVGA